jgi:hypothetical protein
MKFILSTVILFSSLALNAQSTRFGIKIEPQSTWFTVIGDNSDKGSNGAGINIGLMADKYFAENYALELGISLNSTNAGLSFFESTTWKLNNKNKEVGPNQEVTLRTQYVDIPIGLKFLSKSIGYVKIYAHLGANGMFRVRALTDVDGLLENNDAKEEVALFNLAYHFGGGVEYSLGGNTSIVAGINYTSGFSDVTSEKADDATLNMLAFRVGIMF